MEKITKDKKNNQANTSNSNEDRSVRFFCEYCEGIPMEDCSGYKCWIR